MQPIPLTVPVVLASLPTLGVVYASGYFFALNQTIQNQFEIRSGFLTIQDFLLIGLNSSVFISINLFFCSTVYIAALRSKYGISKEYYFLVLVTFLIVVFFTAVESQGDKFIFGSSGSWMMLVGTIVMIATPICFGLALRGTEGPKAAYGFIGTGILVISLAGTVIGVREAQVFLNENNDLRITMLNAESQRICDSIFINRDWTLCRNEHGVDLIDSSSILSVVRNTDG